MVSSETSGRFEMWFHSALYSCAEKGDISMDHRW